LDTGATWNALNSGLQNLNVRALTFWNSFLFAGTDGGIFRMTNGGSNWLSSSSGITSMAILTVTAHGSPDAIVAGTEGGGIFGSTDGQNWTAINTGLTSLNIRVLLDKSAYLAGTDSGIFLANSSTSWIARNNGLVTRDIRALLDLPAHGTHALAGTDSGIFSGVDYDATGSPHFNWRRANEGLTDLNVRTLALARPGGLEVSKLFAGTPTGIWRRHGLEVMTTGVSPKGAVTKHFEITFKGSLSLNLPSASSVSLTAYTLSGKKVGVLLNKKLEAGSHVLSLDTRLPKGLYVYHLRAGNITEVQKVLLTH
jgi:hypothetical protein